MQLTPHPAAPEASRTPSDASDSLRGQPRYWPKVRLGRSGPAGAAKVCSGLDAGGRQDFGWPSSAGDCRLRNKIITTPVLFQVSRWLDFLLPSLRPSCSCCHRCLAKTVLGLYVSAIDIWPDHRAVSPSL
jgi:hypothetical protein